MQVVLMSGDNCLCYEKFHLPSWAWQCLVWDCLFRNICAIQTISQHQTCINLWAFLFPLIFMALAT